MKDLIIKGLVVTGLLLILSNLYFVLRMDAEKAATRRLRDKIIEQEAEAVGLRLKALDFEISAINFINQNQEYFLGLGCTAFDETPEQIEAKMSVLPKTIGRGGN